MKTTIDHKEAKDLLLAFGAIAIIPVVAWLLRPRPLAAASLSDLAEAARTARQQTIVDEMGNYTATSLNFDGPDAKPKTATRWQWVETELQRVGATPYQANIAAQKARNEFSSYWPVLAERGYLRGHAVWLIVGAQSHGTTGNWICPPSANELFRARIAGLCGDLKVVAIAAEFPHQSLH